ncbi:carbohydrate kinase [Roseivivax sp. GX 12232]|uniref:FGGY-family carbohydrate kinase n=1 Tax=Roseivivax sp. GX 12232 TaxID=2900547 RepID=UPI001E48D24B|nr:FGGY-family carbohydrate kinase [Roseivivax sp. GX 12232]MCE0505847.1 carbohydrate kinase [Roseivivax sp. GX 12232]
MACLIGLDSGLTVTKAVLFSDDGRELAVARRRVPRDVPRPRHVERDMDALWAATAEAISEVIAEARIDPGEVAAIAATAHGDGLYLLDRDKAPLGPAILSLDSRAEPQVAAWRAEGISDRALALTGQVPHASAPSALLAWIAREEPDRFARIGHILSCKDWLRFCLTGEIGTDRTEASTAFTALETQDYTPEALALYGLEALWSALPPASPVDAVVGHVTEAAARRCGLRPGTPVAAGLHDVTASALGIGGQRAGAADVVAGTYSINQVICDSPHRDARWFCRNGIAPGTWNAMSISPASTTNYDWFAETLCRDGEAAPDHAALAAEMRTTAPTPGGPIFHPYLYGSPQGGGPSGGFLGLRGWHGRGDLLRAVLEGIAFNHRHHIDALGEGFAFDRLRLTGGVSRNPDFAQLMADVTGLPVLTSATGEAAAWGAALCAGAAAGLWESPFDDPRDLSALETAHTPDPDRVAAYAARYALYTEAAAALTPVWEKIEALSEHEDKT